MSIQNPVTGFDISFVGLYYALSGTGGYEIEQGAKNITMLPVNQINQYDVTDSVQVLFDVRIINEKLGLYKDPTNQYIITTSFDTSMNAFPTQSISITAHEFVTEVHAANIISVGKLITLYSEFITYINNYFGYANGFSTIFTLSSQFDINAGIFDANAFINLINGSTLNPITGEYITDLSGSIQIEYVNDLLNAIVYSNPFNNRNQHGNNGLGYSNKDGFIAGDLIFVPLGLTITLRLNIINNNVNLNNLGTTHVAQLCSASNYVHGYFSSNTTVTNTEIVRIVKAPLLIQLANLS